MKKSKCITAYCRNDTTTKLCSKCQKRIYRAKYPEKAAYQNLRSSAKRRGKAFDLTYEEFLRFAIKTDYVTRKGKTRHSLSIDRIRNEEGYHKDNIRVLPLGQNSSKHILSDYEWQTKTMKYREFKLPDMSDVPF